MNGFKFIIPLNEFMNVPCTEPDTDVLVMKTEKLDKHGSSDFYQEWTMTHDLPLFGSFNIQLNIEF
jgi:hypothetical protein